MPGPLLFFIFIVVIDLILKSAKDKQKIEEARKRRTQELSKQPGVPTTSRPMTDLRKILSQEIEKERQRELARRQGKTVQRQSTLFNEKRPKTSTVDKKIGTNEVSWEIVKEERNIKESKKPEVTQAQSRMENKERTLREDILRGIIFSEILSEPKSLQNQRRSL